MRDGYNTLAMQRRNFLAASVASAMSAQRVLGANDRIRLALIGAGGRGRRVTQYAVENPGADVVAVSDVYLPRMDEAERQWGVELRKHQDYRTVLDDPSIDGVIIATPDHWHVPLILEAVDAGKDVYCEKPVTQRMDEGERLIAGVESSNQVVATGTQQRSWDHYRAAKQAVDEGLLGEINFVESYWYQNYLVRPRPGEVDVSKLDWTTWLGARAKRDFDLVLYRRWRFLLGFRRRHLHRPAHTLDRRDPVVPRRRRARTRPGLRPHPSRRLAGDARNGHRDHAIPQELHRAVPLVDARDAWTAEASSSAATKAR